MSSLLGGAAAALGNGVEDVADGRWWNGNAEGARVRRGRQTHTHTHHAVVRIEIHLIEPSYCSMSPGSACSSSCCCCHHLLIYEIFAGFGCKWKSIGPVRGGPSSTSIFPDLTCSRSRSPAVAKQLRGVAHNLLWSVSHLESCQPAGSLALWQSWRMRCSMPHAACCFGVGF